MYVVYETLAQLGVTDKTVITVFNKKDLLEQPTVLKDFKAERTLMVSAATGEGLEELKDTIAEILRAGKVYLEKLFPYSQAGRIQMIRQYGSLLSEEYTEDGIVVTAYVPADIYERI